MKLYWGSVSVNSNDCTEKSTLVSKVPFSFFTSLLYIKSITLQELPHWFTWVFFNLKENKNQLLQKSSVLISDTLSSVMFSYLLNAWSPHKFKLTDTPQIFSRKSLMFETLSAIHSNSSHTQLHLWEPSLTCTPEGGILIQKSNSKSIGASFLSFLNPTSKSPIDN